MIYTRKIMELVSNFTKCVQRGNLLEKQRAYARLFSTRGIFSHTTKYAERRTFQKPQDRIGREPRQWILLAVPITCFGLGIWQIRRKEWKENLILELNKRRNSDVVDLPDSLDAIQAMEYCPVHIKGKYKYDREFYLGPVSLIEEEGKKNVPQGLISSNKSGYLVITPFELSDRNMTILVNRGWIPVKDYSGKSIKTKKVEGEIELTGVIRLNDQAGVGMRNKPDTNLWTYRDIQKMADFANTDPVFVDADAASTLPGGPIGGQTRVSLRNEHLSYIITWFGLSAFSGMYWYMKFVRRRPALAFR